MWCVSFTCPPKSHLQSILPRWHWNLYTSSSCSLSRTSLFHCISFHGSLQIPCTQYSYMFSHLERLAREVKIFQVILFMIHSRLIVNWCVTASWIPDGTTSLGYEPAYARGTGMLIVFGLTTLIYWKRFIIWPIIYNLSLMSPFLFYFSFPSFSFLSLYLAHSLSLSPSFSLFFTLLPRCCLPLKAWANSRSMSYHHRYGLKNEHVQITLL